MNKKYRQTCTKNTKQKYTNERANKTLHTLNKLWKEFSFRKIQHDIHWEQFTPLSVTTGNLSNEYCESEKISHILHFKRWQRLIPFSQRSPSYPGGHKHRYPLSVNPDWQVALFSQWGLLSQAFWRRKNK